MSLSIRFSAIVAVALAIAGCGPSVYLSPPGAPRVSPTPTRSPSPHPSPSPSAKASATPTATPTSTPTPTATPTTSGPALACASNAKAASIGPAGGSISNNAATGTFSVSATAGLFATATTVSLAYEPATSLPAPLLRAPILGNDGRLRPDFTAGAGNTYVLSLCTSFTTNPTGSLVLAGSGGIVPASIPAGTQLNIAVFANGTWTDVGTAQVTAIGSFQTTPATVALPGITQGGTYLVYLPAPGSNTTPLNLGFALIADDSTASIAYGFQFVQLEDATGNAIPTPTTTFFPVSSSATDLDGQSLTPDASQGAAVDGGNNVYFFSGLPQHTFTLSPTVANVSTYGGDGDSIVSLPNGDQAVVSANGTQLVVISGVLAGAPVIADTIDNGDSMTFDRDGLVISPDGTVLLSRGQSGLDVFRVMPTAPHAGSTGTGTTSYAFSLVSTLLSSTTNGIATPYFEDGRDGMAISPADSSRAVVIGYATAGTPIVQLLTGLTGATPTVSSIAPRFSPVARKIGSRVRHPEASPHRRPFALTPTVGSTLYAVSITPDGTTAYVSTDAGILTIGGVNTGVLTQVGGAYSPSLPVSGGSCPLAAASSIGVLPDGKYLIADVDCALTPGLTDSTQGTGVVVTIPIGAGGALGAPVGQLDNVVTPFNDQIIFH